MMYVFVPRYGDVCVCVCHAELYERLPRWWGKLAVRGQQPGSSSSGVLQPPPSFIHHVGSLGDLVHAQQDEGRHVRGGGRAGRHVWGVQAGLCGGCRQACVGCAGRHVWGGQAGMRGVQACMCGG